MRAVIVIDQKIDKEEALSLFKDYGDWYESQTTIPCTFWLERRDFSQVPTMVESDGDMKPTEEYRKMLTDDVHKRYNDYGTDHVVMMVHEDNFLYRGIWGQAWAYIYRKYMFELCRWDKDNKVNTLNTTIHEIEHTADRLIKEELGININPIIERWLRQEYKNDPVAIAYLDTNGFDYDRDYVHGNSPMFAYIGKKGYKRDGRMLKFLAPYLKKAYQARKDKHFAPLIVEQKKFITLINRVLATLLRR